jgi:hypothetical protein
MNRSIFLSFALLCCAPLSGCANVKWLDNRVACTVAGDEAHLISKWGPVGIGSQIAAADAAVLCKKPA